MTAKRIGYLSVLDFNLHRSRLKLMQVLRKAGMEVFVITPEGRYAQHFREAGMQFVPYPLDRTTFNPWIARRQIREITALFRELQLDVVHTFTLRPNVYGALASRNAHVPTTISTVSGLGSLYSENAGVKATLLRKGVDWFTRNALRHSACVIFQNRDDRQYYIDRNICSTSQARLICSSGVDVTTFSRDNVSQEDLFSLREKWNIACKRPVVTMVTRFVVQKGIWEFIAVAETLADRAQFVLVGDSDPGNPNTIPRSQIQPFVDHSIIIAPGHQDNIPAWLALSDIYLYPSYYREGVPRTVLEAMAMELPIVTTDSPGCREPVRHEENGYLVTTRNVADLKKRVQGLLDDEALRQRMGARSREIILARFSAEAILRQYLTLYTELGIIQGGLCA